LSDLRSEALALAPTLSPSTPNVFDPFVAWMLRYPAEPYLPLAAASTASRDRPQAAMPWLNRALELGPHLAPTHLALTQVLAREGHIGQALLETKLAAEYDSDFRATSASLATSLARSADDLISAIPEGPDGQEYAHQLMSSLPASSPLRVPFREHLLADAPCTVDLRDQLVREALDALSRHLPPCDTPAAAVACGAHAAEEIARLEACPGGHQLALGDSAELAWDTGERKEALEALDRACNEGAQDLTSCLKLLAERSADAHDKDRVARNVRLVVSRNCQGQEECARQWSWATATFRRAGDSASAYMAATKACEMDPSNIELRRQLADAALDVGARDRAEVALLQLLQHRPDDAAAKARLAQIRAMPLVPALPPMPSSSAPRPSPISGRGGARGATTL
jgi:tetratricopeptide (TPR) repeat protein